MTVPELPGAGLEAHIGRWRGYVERHRAISMSDVAELEVHLRDQIDGLRGAGLHDDEAFLIALKRMGAWHEVSREFANAHSERLWKQLVLAPVPPDGTTGSGARSELLVVLGLALGAGLAIKLPALFGVGLADDPGFYARNLSLFVLPFLSAYFAWKRQLPWTSALRMLAAPFAIGALAANAYPFAAEASTEILTALHLPVVLWFAVGLVYAAGDWRSHPRRMDFIRFTGELVIYYTLLALGGAVLVGLTAAGFSALDLEIEGPLTQWVLPCGAMGAVIVAAWLVEARQSVVENIAPVLTAVFTPLTTIMLLAYLAAIIATGDLAEVDRDLLILADLVLVLVLGLLLYAISARDPQGPPGMFDRLQLLLLCSAVLIDALVLAAMLGRIAEFGTSPNKVAALGLNLILLANLAWSARLGVDFLRGRPFAAVEHWQTRYLPVFAAWAAVVAAAFPPLFGWE